MSERKKHLKILKGKKIKVLCLISLIYSFLLFISLISNTGILFKEEKDNLNFHLGRLFLTSESIKWKDNGIAICDEIGYNRDSQIVSDGSGGAILIWIDERSGNYQLYAQRINSMGDEQWFTNGVALCTPKIQLGPPEIINDGYEGAIVAWCDNRTGNLDIYARHIESNSAIEWGSDGISICGAANDQFDIQLIMNCFDDSIVAWCDNRRGNLDIYAQKIDSEGYTQWSANGVAICNATEDQMDPQLVCDDYGGAVIVWCDNRSGNLDIYGQQVDFVGYNLWTTNGVVICNTIEDQTNPQLVLDGFKGVIVSWEHLKSISNSDIYSQGIIYDPPPFCCSMIMISDFFILPYILIITIGVIVIVKIKNQEKKKERRKY